jgi:hypothetical protein
MEHGAWSIRAPRLTGVYIYNMDISSFHEIRVTRDDANMERERTMERSMVGNYKLGLEND